MNIKKQDWRITVYFNYVYDLWKLQLVFRFNLDFNLVFNLDSKWFNNNLLSSSEIRSRSTMTTAYVWNRWSYSRAICCRMMVLGEKLSRSDNRYCTKFELNGMNDFGTDAFRTKQLRDSCLPTPMFQVFWNHIVFLLLS